jgi:hypothetical protein
MILTGASPVTTFLAFLRLKCSGTPCGYQEHYPRFREHSHTLSCTLYAIARFMSGMHFCLDKLFSASV